MAGWRDKQKAGHTVPSAGQTPGDQAAGAKSGDSFISGEEIWTQMLSAMEAERCQLMEGS